ncbi:MAG: hypothetical protein H0T05_04410 [Acidobacteria bacterium]|nr:hypothetical protein [Acidobacteriota bacterium]
MFRSFQLAAAVLGLVAFSQPGLLAQTLEEVVAKNLAAKGGAETLRATNTARLQARVSIPPPRPDADPLVMRIIVWTQRPNLVRRDMTVGDETRTLGFDGKTVWQSTPAGVAPVTGPQADAFRSEGEFDSVLLTYQEQGHLVELLSDETLDSQRVHRIRVQRKEGPIQTYYLDVETGLEHKVTTESNIAGQRVVSEMLLSDYRTIDGRRAPFKARQFVNGQLAAEISFEEVVFNVPFRENLFSMPGR